MQDKNQSPHLSFLQNLSRQTNGVREDIFSLKSKLTDISSQVAESVSEEVELLKKMEVLRVSYRSLRQRLTLSRERLYRHKAYLASFQS
jgi:hypothetical protein